MALVLLLLSFLVFTSPQQLSLFLLALALGLPFALQTIMLHPQQLLLLPPQLSRHIFFHPTNFHWILSVAENRAGCCDT